MVSTVSRQSTHHVPPTELGILPEVLDLREHAVESHPDDGCQHSLQERRGGGGRRRRRRRKEEEGGGRRWRRKEVEEEGGGGGRAAVTTLLV